MPGPAPLTRQFRFTSVLLIAALPLPAAAQDLLQVYREAQRNDAVFAAARHALDAGRERLPQGLALLLPTLNLTGSATRTRVEVDSDDPLILPSTTRNPESANYTLTLTQPIFRQQNWLQYQQGGQQVRQAEATFGQASQDLIIRVAQAYFDVLAAHDTLALVRAQKTATAEQLAQAKRNFEVGTATITDTHEAQARYDLIAAQEIAALNDLESKRRALQLITGREPGELATLRPDVKLAPPNPPDMQTWVDLAEKQGYPVQIAEAAAEVAVARGTAHARGAPADARFRRHPRPVGARAPRARATSGATPRTTVIGLQLAMPLYQGGALNSREREAAALNLKAKEDLENARRNAALAARQNYLLVINGIALVERARAGARLVAERARLEQARLRGRRAHQHRRAERAAAALPHAARPRGRALQPDHEQPAPQGRRRHVARRGPRTGQPRARALKEAQRTERVTHQDALHSILVVRRDNIGDLVCTTPLFSALRRRYPRAWIGALVNSYNAPVLDRNPDLDGVVVYTKLKHLEPGDSRLGTLARRLAELWALRRRRLDCVVLATPLVVPRSVALARALAPRRIVAFSDEHVRRVTGLHEVERVFSLAAELGVEGPIPPLKVVPDPSLTARALDAFGRSKDKLKVAVQISTRRPAQQWPAERFVALLQRLHALGAAAMLLWAPGPAEPSSPSRRRRKSRRYHGRACRRCPARRLPHRAAGGAHRRACLLRRRDHERRRRHASGGGAAKADRVLLRRRCARAVAPLGRAAPRPACAEPQGGGHLGRRNARRTARASRYLISSRRTWTCLAVAPRCASQSAFPALRHRAALLRVRRAARALRVNRRVGVARLERRARLEREPRRLGEIEHARAEHHRRAGGERLDQVLPAERQEAAADHRHVARRVVERHLAHGVAEVDAGRSRPGTSVAAAPRIGPSRDLVEALRMARNDDDREARRFPGISSSSSFSSPSRVLASSSTGRPSVAFHSRPAASCAASSATSNLRLPVTSTRGAPERAQARGVGLALRADRGQAADRRARSARASAGSRAPSFSDMRALASTHRHAVALRSAASRFGQSSVSISTPRRGRKCSRKPLHRLRIVVGQEGGEHRLAVDLLQRLAAGRGGAGHRRSRGRAACRCSARTSGAAARASPTETACTQSDLVRVLGRDRCRSAPARARGSPARAARATTAAEG